MAHAGTAAATLYHPESLRLGIQRPPLVDCLHGFRPALLEFFAHDAAQDGVPIGPSPKVTALDRESDRWISHFTVSDGIHTYRGIVYVEPELNEGDDDDGPPPLPPARHRSCSASFVDEKAAPSELKALEAAYRELCKHFGVAP